MSSRPSVDDLTSHLLDCYEEPIAQLSRLDAGVYRVHRVAEPDWVARVFVPPRRPEDVQGDAEILNRLERAGFPAERCATSNPVTSLGAQTVLVTTYADGQRSTGSGHVYAWLGALLGILHSKPGTDLRQGGGWHHLVPRGGPDDEVASALERLAESPDRVRTDPGYEELMAEVDSIDSCLDLPQCFVHPDFVPMNAISLPGVDRPTIVDWTNAGRGPRAWSIGFLLWAAGARSLRLVDVAMPRYLRHSSLTDAEWDRLPAAIAARPLTIDAWAVAEGRMTATDALRAARRRAQPCRVIAERAKLAVDEPM